MPISWPATLPLPTIEGYGVHPGEAIPRTEMEAGPARQRRRFTQAPSRISVRWVLRRDQFALFEAWYRWQAKEGGGWFTIDLLGGLGLVSHEARFTRQFTACRSSKPHRPRKTWYFSPPPATVRGMRTIVVILVALVREIVPSRATLQVENIVLRQ